MGPALALLWVLPALSPARWPRASAWSQIWAPLLPAGPGLPTLEKGSKPNPLPLPALQHGQDLEARAACACGICWEPGKGWPCQMCEHSWGEAVPTSLSSYFNPKVGLLVPLSLSCTSLAWGWLLSTLAPSWMDLTLFYSFTFCIFLHQKREQAGPCCISPPGASCSIIPQRPGAAGNFSGLAGVLGRRPALINLGSSGTALPGAGKGGLQPCAHPHRRPWWVGA